MGYNYKEERAKLFTELHQKDFLAMRDKANRLLKDCGIVTMGSLINGFTGSSWEHMAYVDRLVELGELKEVKQDGYVMAQNRIFTK